MGQYEANTKQSDDVIFTT